MESAAIEEDSIADRGLTKICAFFPRVYTGGLHHRQSPRDLRRAMTPRAPKSAVDQDTCRRDTL